MAVSGQDTGHKTQDTGTHGHEMSFPKIRTKRNFPKSVSKCYSQNQLRTGYRDTRTRDVISQNHDKTSLPKFLKNDVSKSQDRTQGHRNTRCHFTKSGQNVISQNQGQNLISQKSEQKHYFQKSEISDPRTLLISSHILCRGLKPHYLLMIPH